MKKVIAENLSFLQAVKLAEENDRVSMCNWVDESYYYKGKSLLLMSEGMGPPKHEGILENEWQVWREVEEQKEPGLMTDEEIYSEFSPNRLEDWTDDAVESTIRLARKQGRLEFKPFIALVLEYFGDSQRTGKENTELFLKIKEMIPNLPKFD